MSNIYETLKYVPTETENYTKLLGFKGTDRYMCCHNNFQYKLGKWYTHKGKIIPCESGFHLCKNFIDVFNYYRGRDNNNDEHRYFIVEYGEKYIKEGDKIVTDKIRLVKEIRYSDIEENIDDKDYITYCLILMTRGPSFMDYEKIKYLIRKGADVERPGFSLISFLDMYCYYNLMLYTIRYNPDVDLSKAKNYGKQIAKSLEKHNHYDLYDVELFNLSIYKDGKLYPSVS